MAITLLLVCDAADEPGELRPRIEAIADRYADTVELRVVSPDEARALGGDLLPGPAVMVLRDGELVGQALGARLPKRELDRVVRCAVEWPATA